ncbi:MAG: glutamate-5-semialdehyde dehydrogenase, partial [Raoultibacter sp.]
GICIKTGNACVLRGGSLAAHSNAIIARIVHEAAVEAGMSVNCIRAIETTDRAATDELMSLHGVVDVLIPRGGAGLIRHCVEHSKVPVIETGTGNCHIYVHEAADFAVAQAIVLNAKLRRLGVCNAAEGLLVDRSIAEAFLPAMMSALADNGVCLHADEQALTIAQNAGITSACAATDEDWATEYLDLDISVTCVDGLEEAIEHINRYGTKHSEAIITADEIAADRFAAAVDAAAVYVNASTAFTDGGEFGMGAEIGISTQKLHARGPFALEALTSYKYVLRGTGQVRA